MAVAVQRNLVARRHQQRARPDGAGQLLPRQQRQLDARAFKVGLCEELQLGVGGRDFETLTRDEARRAARPLGTDGMAYFERRLGRAVLGIVLVSMPVWREEERL